MRYPITDLFPSSCRCLVSKLFDVCSNSTLEEMEQQDEVKVAWGTGIAGHVAESGEPVNIPDAYQVSTVEVWTCRCREQSRSFSSSGSSRSTVYYVLCCIIDGVYVF